MKIWLYLSHSSLTLGFCGEPDQRLTLVIRIYEITYYISYSNKDPLNNIFFSFLLFSNICYLRVMAVSVHKAYVVIFYMLIIKFLLNQNNSIKLHGVGYYTLQKELTVIQLSQIYFYRMSGSIFL